MTRLLPPRNNLREFHRGFSLIELMIAITLGLLIMTGLVSIFVKNSQARTEIERSNRQLESGRYAMSLLTEDLRMAGYFSSFNPYEKIIGASPEAPPLGADTSPVTAAMGYPPAPDPCDTTVANLNRTFFFHVQGYDNAATVPSCVSDTRAGSDILVVRRLSTCVAGPTLEAGCDALPNGAPYFQASNCFQATELASNTGSRRDYQTNFVLNTDLALATLRTLSCATSPGVPAPAADYRRYLTHIYFVANNNAAGDGIPTLKRAELGVGGFTIVPLVEGIETIQFEYGVGNTANSAIISAYTADPWTYNGCAGHACLLNWLHTYSVKVNLLARNVEQSPGWTDNKIYTLGLKADGSANLFPASGTYGDRYKRHAYNAVVRLDNPSGRVTP